jgi:hypothetical protein
MTGMSLRSMTILAIKPVHNQPRYGTKNSTNIKAWRKPGWNKDESAWELASRDLGQLFLMLSQHYHVFDSS